MNRVLSRGKSAGFGALQEDERIPDVLVLGRATYSANLNASNPVGTVQSIEHALRNLDKLAAEQQNRATRIEKELVDYRVQADRPFEHEERLKQLLARQSELNSLLDLDRADQQGAALGADKDDPENERTESTPSRDLADVAKDAVTFMRTSGTAILEAPISERIPPKVGQVTARAVRRNDMYIAFATSGNSFFVIPSTSLRHDVRIGERLSLNFSRGQASIVNGRDRGR
jgi:hypothetical protein